MPSWNPRFWQLYTMCISAWGHFLLVFFTSNRWQMNRPGRRKKPVQTCLFQISAILCFIVVFKIFWDAINGWLDCSLLWMRQSMDLWGGIVSWHGVYFPLVRFYKQTINSMSAFSLFQYFHKDKIWNNESLKQKSEGTVQLQLQLFLFLICQI